MRRPELHVLTDDTLVPGRSHLDVARAAFAGGADVVQLRDKTRSAAELEGLARELVDLARRAGVRLVVDDRLDVALAADAHGLHVGPEDLPAAEARLRWPRPRLLGGSARTVERALALSAAGCDYLGVGPVFGTSTKPGLPLPIGLERIAKIARSVPVPVIGIGGIHAGNAADVIAAGACGVAVLAAVAGAPDPERAVRELRAALDRTAGVAAPHGRT
jgi:thiamine-phosphate pyrophosphorylase